MLATRNLSQPRQVQCLDSLSLEAREDVLQIDGKVGLAGRPVIFATNKPGNFRICLNTARTLNGGLVEAGIPSPMCWSSMSSVPWARRPWPSTNDLGAIIQSDRM